MSGAEEKGETKVDQGEQVSTAPAVRLEDVMEYMRDMAQNVQVEFSTMRTKIDNLSGDVATIQNEQYMTANELDGLREETARLSGSGQSNNSRVGGGTIFGTGTPMMAPGFRRSSNIFGPLGGRKTLFGDNSAEDSEGGEKKDLPEGTKEYNAKDFFNKAEVNPRLVGQQHFAVSIPLEKVSLKIETLTINSLIKAKKTMREDAANSAAPGARGFDEYFSHEVKEKIVSSEKTMRTDLGAVVTLDNFSAFSDELILKMAARYIRRIPGEGTVKGFKEVFIKSIGSVKIIDTERGPWVPETKGWNKHVHQPLADWILRFRDVYFILTFGVLRGELIPEEDYRKEPVGLIRIAVEILEDLKDVVIQFLTEERLKKMKSMAEFVTALEDMNEHFHNSDFELTKQDSKITKEKDYKEVVRDLLQKSSARRDQYDKRREELGIGKVSGFPRRVDTPTRSFNVPRRPHLSRYAGEDSDEDEAKIAPLEEEEDNGDDEEVVKGPKPFQEQPINAIAADENGMFDERYSQTMMRMEFTEKGSTKSTDQKVRNKNEMPCFVFVDKGVCDDKERCEYSHDMNLCREYAKKALQKSSRSPLLSKEDIASVIGNAKSHGNAAGSDSLRKHTSFQSNGPSLIPRIASRSSYPPSRLKEMTSQSLADEMGMADGQAPN